MLKRLPFVLFVAVAFDFLLLAALWRWFGLKPTLVGNGLTTVAGLAIIIYYEWRWSETIAMHLERDAAALDSWAIEKLLLLVAGIVMLNPGLLTVLCAVKLLVPRVRHLIATRSNPSIGRIAAPPKQR